MPSVLDDLAVDKGADVRHRILLRAVQFVSISSGTVIVQHLFKGLTNVNDVNRPELLLQVVGCDDIGGARETVEESVLESKHRGGPDDGSFWEDIAHDLFALCLGAIENRWGVGRGRVRGNVHKAVDVVFCDRAGDTVRSFDMDIF